MVEAENVVSVFPRYESKWFMFSLPISIYEYESVRVGTAMRIGFLTVGSDHLLSLFGKSDFRGSSFYAALKIIPFGKRGQSKSSERNRNIDCPVVKG